MWVVTLIFVVLNITYTSISVPKRINSKND